MSTIEEVLAKRDGTEFAIALSDLVFGRWDRDGFGTLTAAEKVAYCVDALEREVNNGGFEQYFFNSSGDTAVEAESALEAIGAHRAAALLREASAAFPGGVPDRDADRRGVWIANAPDDVRARWNELSAEFQAYPDDITTLMRAYVEGHREGFRPAIP